jgi:hypothetical protein
MARNDIKYAKLEENGVEIDIPVEHIPVAKDISFSYFGYMADNVEGAIVEGVGTALNTPQLTYALTHNATVGAVQWLALTDLLSNPRHPMPRKILFEDLTWNNSNIDLGPFVFEFYKNGQTLSELVYTYTPTSTEKTQGYGVHSFSSSIIFEAQDVLYIKHVRTSGTSLSDLGFVLWLRRLPS